MSIFQAVKERLRIVDVVGEYTTLQRAGGYFKANCPFHHERTASFTVTPDREIFYCFGCRAGGDVIEFISQMEKCTPREAVAHLVERYKLAIPADELTRYHGENWAKQHRYNDVCKLLADWFHEQLKSFPNAQAYLKNRGISAQSAERFGIGYFPSGEVYRRRLMALLHRQSFLLDELIEIKLFLRSEQRASAVYSPFEDRIIFPIRDHLGRVCGFGGRTFLPGDDRPKYYNSHDHAHFSKSALLFGFDLAKREIQRTSKVYVVEGYIDAVVMAQAGVANVVATLGTACTEEHLKLLGRYVHRVTVMYDGDAAGVSATLRVGELCWDYALELYVVMLPAGQDPADFFVQGGDFLQLVHYDIFSFYVQVLRLQFQEEQPLAEKVQSVRDILKRIARVSNKLTRDLLVQQVAQVCSLPLATLMREIESPRNAVARPSTEAAAEHKPKGQKREINVPDIDIFAGQAFCLVLQQMRLTTDEERDLIMSLLPERLHTFLTRMADFRVAYAKDNGATECHFSDFFVTLHKEDQEYLQQIIIAYGANFTDVGTSGEEALKGLIQRCRTKKWKQTIKSLQEHLVSAQRNGDHGKLQELLSEFKAIKKNL